MTQRIDSHEARLSDHAVHLERHDQQIAESQRTSLRIEGVLSDLADEIKFVATELRGAFWWRNLVKDVALVASVAVAIWSLIHH